YLYISSISPLYLYISISLYLYISYTAETDTHAHTDTHTHTHAHAHGYWPHGEDPCNLEDSHELNHVNKRERESERHRGASTENTGLRLSVLGGHVLLGN